MCSENCTIGPSELYTRMPGKQPLNYEIGSKGVTEGGEAPGGIAVPKMIDWSLALDLKYNDESKIDAAFKTLRLNEGSLNQSLAFIKRSPLFLDIEVKKQQPENDPEVQIAIWASAALKKRWRHAWDTSIPMPAIIIEGHVWKWYIFMAQGEGLV